MEAERAKIEIGLAGLIASALKAKDERSRANMGTEIEGTPSGEKLTWNVTAEQIAKINAGDRKALNDFYFDEGNAVRLRGCAQLFMKRNSCYSPIASVEDLMQQVYYDLASGLLKLRPWDSAIKSAVNHSLRYAVVGGIEEVYMPYSGRRRVCQKQVN